MDNLVEMVRHAEPEQLDRLLWALKARYAEANPDYELIVLSIAKKRDFSEQMDEVIRLMKNYKEYELRKRKEEKTPQFKILQTEKL